MPVDSGRRVALMIAVDTFLDEELRQLRAPSRDAAAFGEVLGEPDLGGFEVISLVNGNAHEVRLAIVEFLTDRRPDDVALVYLSCHGLIDARRRLYFAAADTLKNRLPATGIESHWVLDQLEECRARRQVVILDCCFSGAFARGAKGDADLGLGERFLGQGRGRVVLTASRGTEYSFEGSPVPGSAIPGSVFTNALVAGIRSGAADVDRDGYISVDDAYTYAFDEMRVAGAEQTPQRWLYGAEGSILLARNPAASAAPLSQPPRSPVTHDERPAVRGRRRQAPSWASRLRTLIAGHRVLAGCLAVGVGVVALGALLWGTLDGAANPPGDGASVSGTPKSGTATFPGPWTLLVDATPRLDGLDGCQVMLTDTQTGASTAYPNGEHGPEQETSLWQIHQGGNFRWTVNDTSCVVLPRSSTVDVKSSPFEPEFTHGDSEAFDAKDPVAVKVTDFQGAATCTVYLNDIATGDVVDRKVATTENPVVELDPGPAHKAYISDPSCDIHVTP